MQDTLNPDNYSRMKDGATLAVGVAGASLNLVTIVNYIQMAGVVAGSLVAFYQLYKILKNEFKGWRRKRGANDR